MQASGFDECPAWVCQHRRLSTGTLSERAVFGRSHLDLCGAQLIDQLKHLPRLIINEWMQF